MKIKGSAIFFEHPVASNQMLIKSNFAPLGNPVEAPVKKQQRTESGQWPAPIKSCLQGICQPLEQNQFEYLPDRNMGFTPWI